MMRRHRRTFLALAAVSTVALAALPAALAQVQDETAVPEELRGPRITLAEAVASTLRNSYNLRQSEEAVEQRRGVTLEAAGLFDRLLFLQSDFTFKQQELLRAGRDQEIKRRVPLEFLAIGTPDDPNRGALDQAADAIIAGLPTAGSLLFDDCRLGQTRFIIEVADGTTVTLCLNSSGLLQGVVLGSRDFNLVVPGISVGTLPSGLGIRVDDLDELIFLLQILQVLDAEFLADLQQDIEEQIADLLREIASLLRSVASVLRLQRARLGALP